LARGHAEVVASEDYEGQPALKVQVAAGTDAQHIAYLNPEHLLPLAVVVTNASFPEQAGIVEEISYQAIETFAAGDIPAGAFDTEPPADEVVPRQIVSRKFTVDDAQRFADYPLWSPEASVDGYNLITIDRYADTGADSNQEDHVSFTYQRGDDRGAQIQITCYGRLMDHVRNEYVRQRIDSSEEIATATGPAWLWANPYHDNVRIDLDRENTLIVINAPDRASGLAAVAALRRTNGE
jgi:hypothetical protein